MPQVQLPDGRVLDIPDDATPEQLAALKTKLAKDFPEAVAPQQAEQPQERPSSVKRPENLAEGLAGSAETLARSAGRGFFGVGDNVGAAAATAVDAAGNVIDRARGDETPRRVNFGERLEQERQRTDDLAKIFPESNVAGTIGGALAPIKAAPAIVSKIPKVGDSFAKALQLTKGQTLKNVARTAGIGGTSAAATEANLGGSADEVKAAAATGAVLAPAVGSVVRLGGGAANLARSALDKFDSAGFEALAKGLSSRAVKISPNELRRRAKEFFDATGRGATLAEILEPGGAQELRAATAAGARGERARDVLQDFAEGRRVNVQDDLAEGIQSGRVVTGADRLIERQGRSFDAFMRENSKRPVTFTRAEARELLRDAGRILPPRARSAIEAVAEGADGVGDISLRQADNIRQALNKAANAGGEAVRFRSIADQVRQITTETIPEFDDALSEFARRARTAEGVRRGSKIASEGETSFRQAVEGADTATEAGIRVGARTALTDAARSSPERARRVAGDLAESSGLGRRLSELDPAEAQRLQRLAKAELNGLNSVKEAVKGTKVGDALQDELDDVQSVLELGTLTTGRFSGGFGVNVLLRTFRRLGVPPTAAEKLARAATDPSKTDEVITILERAGVEPSAAQELARASARVFSRTGAPALAEDG